MWRRWGARLFPRERVFKLSTGEAGLLYAGIFATFAAVGWIVGILTNPIQGIGGGLFYAGISGASACLWAHSFIAARLWLLPIVLVWQIFGPALLARFVAGPLGLFDIGIERPDRAKVVALALCGALSLVIGYILSSIYTRRIAGRTMRAQAELDVARRVHETLVPDLCVRTPSVQVLGRSAASSEMGGDLIDVVVRAGDEVDAYLVDVSGHGVGAGIVMAMVKSSIRTQLREQVGLDELMDGLNAVLSDLVKPGMFATMACARVRADGRCEYALAGHLPIFLWRSATREVVDLPNEHLPLAVDADERFRVGQVRLEAGDTLVLLTDGLVEVMDRAGRQLGLEALRDVLRRVGGDAERVLAELMAAARAHGQQIDDQSVVVVKMGGQGA